MSLRRKSKRWNAELKMTKGMKSKKEVKETTRDRPLRWINYYSNHNFGIWIECTKCKKWRKNKNYDESHEVEENWCCSMNILGNGSRGRCDDPQENIDEVDLEYSPGSVVWAKLDGYPWWPAMVDVDPDTVEYYWKESDGTLYYNVTFLDDNVTRSWVLPKNICPFLKPPTDKHFSRQSMAKYAFALMKAEEKAQTAIKMAFNDRLLKFSFVYLYKGKWPLAKDDERENDRRYMTNTLLNEENNLGSLLSFDSDMSDNLTVPKKKEDLHEESQTTNTDISGNLTHNNLSCAHKNRRSTNTTSIATKDLKGKHDLKFLGNKHSTNIRKSKKIRQPFEKRMKSLIMDKKLKVLGTKIENNTDTNQKDSKLEDYKDCSNCKNMAISNRKRKKGTKQKEKYMEIVKQGFGKNLNIKDKNSDSEIFPQHNKKHIEIVELDLDTHFECKTVIQKDTSTVSEISRYENLNNIDKSKEKVVNKYKITANKAIFKKVKSIGDCQPAVTKEYKKPNVCKLSKKASDKNNQKNVISYPPNKNLVNSDFNMNKRKKETELLHNNTNRPNKKTKSFISSKPSLKTINKQTSSKSNLCSTSPKLSNPNTDFSKRDKAILNGLTQKETSNNLCNSRVQDKAFMKDSKTIIHEAVEIKTVKIHKKRELVLAKNNKMEKPKVKSHKSFNLIKFCENFAKRNTVADTDDSQSD